MSASDMQLIEMELPHVRRISGVFEYPAQLVGDYQSSQYANYGEAQKAAYTGSVLPTWDLINDAIQRDLLNEYNSIMMEDYYIKIDKTRIAVLNTSWEDNLQSLPPNLQNRIIESLDESDIENIKNNIGIKSDQNGK